VSSAPTVLLVEDDPDLLRFARTTLRLGGYRVRTATRGDEALRLVARTRPDLVVLDLRLPGVDGVQVLQALRADPALAATPVVVLTASAGPEDRERALAAGVAAYLLKPVSADDLLAAVERVLPGTPS
jgi:CheY-like chemotaxis protein